MYLLATSLSAIYATFDYAFTIRIDFTSTTAGLASLASYVQLPKLRFFFRLLFPKRLSSYMRILSLFIIYDSYFTLSLALEQALRGAPSHYVSGIWILLSCLSFPPISANVNKHWKARVKGNDVITNVISANKHFASTFSIQMFKFQRRSCNWVLLPFPAPLP